MLRQKKRLPKKIKFYADENIPPETLRFLEKKFNIKHAVLDYGFSGRPDSFHYQQAFDQNRVLLTADQDFLDNRRFPLQKTKGVIALIVPAPISHRKLESLLRKVLPYITVMPAETFKATKLKATPDGLELVTLGPDSRLHKKIHKFK